MKPAHTAPCAVELAGAGLTISALVANNLLARRQRLQPLQTVPEEAEPVLARAA